MISSLAPLGEGERGLHLFSPPCSEQKQDDLCGASAASPRCGRILAFSSAPSRVARVAECGIAFALSRPSLDIALSAAMHLSWMTCDYRPSPPLSPAHPLIRVDAYSRGEANHRVDETLSLSLSKERIEIIFIIFRRYNFYIGFSLGVTLYSDGIEASGHGD